MTLEQKIEKVKPKGKIRRFLDWIELKRIESQFKAISKSGPKIVEVIENEWHGVPYKIIHRDSKYWTWNLSFTGIELPRYDNWYSGGHNGMVKRLFTHLLARELGKTNCEPGGVFNGVESINEKRKVHIPAGGYCAESLSDGNTVARKTIDSYLAYKSKIDMAIQEIERIYDIDPLTRKSREWEKDEPLEHPRGKYPGVKELIPYLRDKCGLDYLNERL